MSDIIINGETYEGVESITVNKTNGEQETFVLPVDLTEYVKNTDYATSTKGGVVKVSGTTGLQMYEGTLTINYANKAHIGYQSDTWMPITPKFLAYAIKRALIEPEKSSTPAEWTDEDRAKARQTLGIGGGAKLYKHHIEIMGDYAMLGYPTTIEVLSYSSSLANSYLNFVGLPKLCCIGGGAYYPDVYGDMYFSDVFGNKASGELSWYDWENGDGTEYKEEYREYDFSQHESDTWTDTVTEYIGG